MNEQLNILWYVHDPMCSWCWGFRKTWQTVKNNLPNVVIVKNLVGGLAPDSDAPMPEKTRQYIQSAWSQVAQVTGAKFNFKFWERNIARRSTYPACRAVIAASLQNKEEAMIEAIQHTYYLNAKNPSDIDVLLQCAKTIDLDLQKFQIDLENVDEEFQNQMKKAQQLKAQGFPSLVLESQQGMFHIPINYQNPQSILQTIQQYL